MAVSKQIVIVGCTRCEITDVRIVESMQALVTQLLEAAQALGFTVSAMELIEADGNVTVVLRGDSASRKPVDLVGDIEIKSILSDPVKAEIKSLAYSYIAYLGSNK